MEYPIEAPWALAFAPDGDLPVVTERPAIWRCWIGSSCASG